MTNFIADIWFNEGLAHIRTQHSTLAAAERCVAGHLRMGGVHIFEIVDRTGEVVHSWDSSEADGAPCPIKPLADHEVHA